jgi:hypothetical protein
MRRLPNNYMPWGISIDAQDGMNSVIRFDGKRIVLVQAGIE